MLTSEQHPRSGNLVVQTSDEDTGPECYTEEVIAFH